MKPREGLEGRNNDQYNHQTKPEEFSVALMPAWSACFMLSFDSGRSS